MELLRDWHAIVQSLLPGLKPLLALFVAGKVVLYMLRWLRWAA